MKKTLFIIMALLPMLASAQYFTLTAEGWKSAEDITSDFIVIPMDGTKAELFQKAKTAVTATYKSAKDVMSFNEPDIITVNGYTEFRISPTDGCRQGIVAVRQSWLTPDQVRAIRDMETRTKGWRRFQDYFMLSYYLGGINIIDIARINFNECADTLHYVRTKTERKQKVNPFVEFKIPDVAKPIIEKYKQPDGYLFISNSPNDHCQYFIGPSHKIRDLLGFADLTYYSARKSFAQHAFNLGISESVIDYILGHSLGSSHNKMLYSYIKVTPDMATDAVRKVCDFIASTRNF